MDFNLSEEEQLLESMVSDFVRNEYSFESRRAILESPQGYSQRIWTQLGELGLLGIGIDEADGGVNAGPVATMLVMNGIGAGLVLEPYLSSAIVAASLLRAADDARHSRELLPAIAAGKSIVVLAHNEAGTRNDAEPRATVAHATGNGFVINGSKAVIAHAQIADTLIVSARSPASDATSLFRVPADAPGLRLDAYRSLDGRVAADVELDGVELSSDALIGTESDADRVLAACRDAGLAAVCAEAVGAMQALIDLTCEYLRTRRQFGRPIGSFQALQHRAADMMIHFEQAKSMSYLATLKSADDDSSERQMALAAAKTVVGRACRFVGQQAIQLHGGMGMTDELSVSHYFRRLTAIEFSFGDTETQIDSFLSVQSSQRN
jgi:alkylation response protein AidB-like acyl-CoA dehydrogenase